MHGEAEADVEAALERAQQAIAAGQWSIAKDAFEALLEPEESGEPLFGLGVASLRHWEVVRTSARPRSLNRRCARRP